MRGGVNAPIGVIDSGVGGLTVLQVLEKRFPEENFLYLGDTIHKTYGNRSQEEIIALSLDMVNYLVEREVKLIVIACNTITVTALEAIKEAVNVPVIGMCRGIERAIATSESHHIGVMATVATINSHKHRDEALAVDETIRFYEQACPDLARLIEDGHVNDAVVEAALRSYMEPMIAEGVDTVIHGCTHYPFVKELMDRIGEGKLTSINPAQETADAVAHALDTQTPNTVKGELELCFTGDADLAKSLAAQLWVDDVPQCKTVTIK